MIKTQRNDGNLGIWISIAIWKGKKAKLFVEKYRKKKIHEKEQHGKVTKYCRVTTHGILNFEVKGFSAFHSSPKGSKNCFRNTPINYRQTMSDDRINLIKMSDDKKDRIIAHFGKEW